MGDSDERFHLRIADALARWARETGRWGEALRVVGERWDRHTSGLTDAMARLGMPFGFYDVASADGKRLLAEAGTSGPLPVVLLADGRALTRPMPADVAGALGARNTAVPGTVDVVVLGAGPAGLASAVYGASEGLSVLVVEPMTIGGQASSSPMVKNYLGFPSGLAGADLAARAYEQAWTFGADFVIGRTAQTIGQDGDARVVSLDDGTQVRGRSIVIATGVSYRRVGIESVERLVGRGVTYGAGTTEARAMAGEPVLVVGGANSAGEAAMHLARYAGHVTVVVRGPSVRDRMSDYLVRELEAAPNVSVETNTEIAEAHGEGRLRSLTLRDRASGSTRDVAACGAFILIGAAPGTEWLPDAIARDERGFVLTGTDGPGAGTSAAPLETTMHGVYAAGDVRHGSEKRVAAAVGEGSTVIRQIQAGRSAGLWRGT
jgi:thioredoxin reductase (NADPH)